MTSKNLASSVTDRYIEDTTDYQGLVKEIDEKVQSSSDGDRFVRYANRKNEGVFTLEQLKCLCHGKYETFWKGINMMKDPLDMVIYQQVLWHEKPSTIIEIGAYTGGTAVWMADTMRLFGHKCHIYSVEYDMKVIDPRSKADKDVTFIEGDATKIAEALPSTMLEDLPHPWIISEDAHADVLGVMEYFHQFLKIGDYFIIEDTCPDTPLVSGQGLLEGLSYDLWGSKKLNLLQKFMETYHEFYRVDTFYTDFFGYNGTFNWNGYIKRVK